MFLQIHYTNNTETIRGEWIKTLVLNHCFPFLTKTQDISFQNHLLWIFLKKLQKLQVSVHGEPKQNNTDTLTKDILLSICS